MFTNFLSSSIGGIPDYNSQEGMMIIGKTLSSLTIASEWHTTNNTNKYSLGILCVGI